jgi:hypothetical protein
MTLEKSEEISAHMPRLIHSGILTENALTAGFDGLIILDNVGMYVQTNIHRG